VQWRSSMACLPTWLNDVISDALRAQGIVPEGILWRVYGPLEVYMPEPEYILALKLWLGVLKIYQTFRRLTRNFVFHCGRKRK